MLKKATLLRIITSLSIAFFAMALFTNSSTPEIESGNADAIIGTWKSENFNYHIELYKEGEYYDGKIIWMKNPNDGAGQPIKDRLNPQRNLREKAILGMVNISGFEYNQYDEIWEEGIYYNPETGQTLKGIIKLVDNNTIELTGFLGFALSEVKMIWTRMEPDMTDKN